MRTTYGAFESTPVPNGSGVVEILSGCKTKARYYLKNLSTCGMAGRHRYLRYNVWAELAELLYTTPSISVPVSSQ